MNKYYFINHYKFRDYEEDFTNLYKNVYKKKQKIEYTLLKLYFYKIKSRNFCNLFQFINFEG